MANGQDFDRGRQMRLFQASMPSFVQGAVFIILVAITAGLAVWTGTTHAPEWGVVVGVTGVVVSLLIAGDDHQGGRRKTFSGQPRGRCGNNGCQPQCHASPSAMLSNADIIRSDRETSPIAAKEGRL